MYNPHGVVDNYRGVVNYQVQKCGVVFGLHVAGLMGPVIYITHRTYQIVAGT